MWVADVPSDVTAFVQITDISGKIMQSFDVRLSGGNAAIDASNLASGLYFCIVKVNGEIKAKLRLAIAQ